MSSFPTIAPSGRSFVDGDWPVKTFNSQSGVEVRILHGNRRYGHKLSLSYDNIADEVCQQFFEHYRSVKGTYETFGIPQVASGSAVAQGWGGDANFFNAGPHSQQYRYAGPPEMSSNYPGISSIRLDLVAVLNPK